MTEYQIGDTVKCLDFNGVDDCYMVGDIVQVMEVEKCIRVRYHYSVWQGKRDKKKTYDYYVCKMQGQMIGDNDKMPRVSVMKPFIMTYVD